MSAISCFSGLTGFTVAIIPARATTPAGDRWRPAVRPRRASLTSRKQASGLVPPRLRRFVVVRGGSAQSRPLAAASATSALGWCGADWPADEDTGSGGGHGRGAAEIGLRHGQRFAEDKQAVVKRRADMLDDPSASVPSGSCLGPQHGPPSAGSMPIGLARTAHD